MSVNLGKVAGSFWHAGSGTPSAGLGLDDDFYLDVANGDVYKKISSTWTIQGNIKGATGANGTNGLDGANGTDGNTWHSGTGTPGAGLGVDGDFYIDTDSNQYYKKISGTWTLQADLTGVSNYIDEGFPSGSLGNDDDVYVERLSEAFMRKVSGSWTFEGPLVWPRRIMGGVAAGAQALGHDLTFASGHTIAVQAGAFAPETEFTTDTLINSQAGFWTDDLYTPAQDPECFFVFRMGASVADIAFWCGYADRDLDETANGGEIHAAVRFNTGAGDTNFMLSNYDGSSQTLVDTGVTPAINTTYALHLHWSSGNPVVSIYSFPFMTLLGTATNSTDVMSSSTGILLNFTLLNLAATIKNIRFIRAGSHN